MYYIYRITNKINGKTYIGQHKYKEEKGLTDGYFGSGKLIKLAIKKYGKENFVKEVLYSRIQYKETADDVEKFAIKKERAIGKAEYNISDGGNGGDLGEAVRKKISEATKGKKAWNKGKHFSEETRKKMSEAHKGQSAWNEGKHRTDEVKRKISETKKGKKHGPHSEETKKKISEAHKGKPAWNKGKHLKLVDGKRVWY